MNKFKSKSQLIMEEFERPQITSEKQYMIDKVVRMRGKQGRFGVDHSEILNFEFEQANKERSDHMNRLVYKSYTTDGDKENSDDGAFSSSLLFQRLTQKEIQAKAEQNSNRGTSAKSSSDDQGLSFNEWVRRKDAEKRMKQRLERELKHEIRQELLEVA